MQERDHELARLDELLAAARTGAGGLVAIEGPPGIGKTSLLDAARERADGLAVVSAAGSELEREYGFAVARELFEPALVEAGADALYGVIHGLFQFAANLAARQPLLIVVDDLQWVDPPSQRFLAYLARRLQGMPIALLVAVRPAVPHEERQAIDAIIGQPGASVLRPAPLSESAISVLARARLRWGADVEFVRACHQATGGNALLVGELLTELRNRRTIPSVAEVAEVERAERSGWSWPRLAA